MCLSGGAVDACGGPVEDLHPIGAIEGSPAFAIRTKTTCWASATGLCRGGVTMRVALGSMPLSRERLSGWTGVGVRQSVIAEAALRESVFPRSDLRVAKWIDISGDAVPFAVLEVIRRSILTVCGDSLDTKASSLCVQRDELFKPD